MSRLEAFALVALGVAFALGVALRWLAGQKGGGTR